MVLIFTQENKQRRWTWCWWDFCSLCHWYVNSINRILFTRPVLGNTFCFGYRFGDMSSIVSRTDNLVNHSIFSSFAFVTDTRGLHVVVTGLTSALMFPLSQVKHLHARLRDQLFVRSHWDLKLQIILIHSLLFFQVKAFSDIPSKFCKSKIFRLNNKAR